MKQGVSAGAGHIIPAHTVGPIDFHKTPVTNKQAATNKQGSGNYAPTHHKKRPSSFMVTVHMGLG